MDARRIPRSLRADHRARPPQNPPGTIPTGKRGVIKQTPARNLLVRLDRDREQVLRFAHDFRVPFDNNLAERDLRMIKIQQKISGCWRTTVGADRFLALRAYISTTRKQGRDTIDALAQLAKTPALAPRHHRTLTHKTRSEQSHFSGAFARVRVFAGGSRR